MPRIKELLKEQIKMSNEFSQKNFGLLMGDGFPEMVKEMFHSTTACSVLLGGLVKTVLFFNPRKMAERPTDSPESQEAFMMDNIDVFRSQLDMFYWGIQIGRRLEREEAAAMKSIEDQMNEKP